MQWSWKEIILNKMNKINLVFDLFDWDLVRCGAVDIYVFNFFINFTDFDLCEQIWLFLQLLYTGKNLSNCLVLGIS